MPTVSVRYIVDDVDAAIGFYTGHLGFTEVMHPAPPFAMLERGDLRLLLSAPNRGPGGGQIQPGAVPEPGGWNRFALEVEDVDAIAGTLRAAGVAFRTDVVRRGRRQAGPGRGSVRKPGRAVPAERRGMARRVSRTGCSARPLAASAANVLEPGSPPA